MCPPDSDESPSQSPSASRSRAGNGGSTSTATTGGTVSPAPAARNGRTLRASSGASVGPPTKKGRPSSAIHSLFTIETNSVTKETIGSKCLRCGEVKKDHKRSGALFSGLSPNVCDAIEDLTNILEEELDDED